MIPNPTPAKYTGRTPGRSRAASDDPTTNATAVAKPPTMRSAISIVRSLVAAVAVSAAAFMQLVLGARVSRFHRGVHSPRRGQLKDAQSSGAPVRRVIISRVASASPSCASYR
jgi:hypothetical protein